MSLRAQRWSRGLLGAMTVTALGCGGCQTSPEHAPPPTASPRDRDEARAAETVATIGELDEVDLPILNEEALQARVEAQRALLGSRRLFEDARGQPVPWLSPAADELPGDPEVDDDLLGSLPGSSGLGGGAAGRSRAVAGNSLGLFEPLEGGGAEAPLQHFYQALDQLRAGHDPDGKVRVLIYGASHTDADIYPHYVRTYLQERFGDGGHGYVHVAKPWKWYGHVDMQVEGLRRWTTEHVQRSSARDDGLFGLLGASLSARSKKAFGRVSPRHGTVGSTYELYFLEHPRGGSFEVVVDGRRKATVDTAGPEVTAGYHTMHLPEGEHVVEVQPVGDGEVRMFGMTSERDGPGVVVDTLGIGGTRAANMLHWDETVWADNVKRRDPDLILLAYGTNEATDANQPIEAYEADLREVLARLQRAAPEASCLIVGPGDFPILGDDGTALPRPRVSEIIEVQSRVAPEVGCAFWDLRAFMGGEMAMVEWVHAVPAMAKPDHIHFTRRGYVRIGMALVDAMMIDYDGGLAAVGSG